MGIAGPDVDLEHLISLTEFGNTKPTTDEVPKPKPEFKRENQLDFLSMYSLKDAPIAA